MHYARFIFKNIFLKLLTGNWRVDFLVASCRNASTTINK